MPFGVTISMCSTLLGRARIKECYATWGHAELVPKGHCKSNWPLEDIALFGGDHRSDSIAHRGLMSHYGPRGIQLLMPRNTPTLLDPLPENLCSQQLEGELHMYENGAICHLGAFPRFFVVSLN